MVEDKIIIKLKYEANKNFLQKIAYLQVNKRRKQPKNKLLEDFQLSCSIIQRNSWHIQTLFPAVPPPNAKSYCISSFISSFIEKCLTNIIVYIYKVYNIMIWYTYMLWNDYQKVTLTNDFLQAHFGTAFNLSSIYRVYLKIRPICTIRANGQKLI